MATRRSFLKSGLGLLSFAMAGPLLSRVGYASAPFAGVQAPGFHRMMLGSIEITALSDGTLPVPLESVFNNTTPEHVDAVLTSAFLDSPVELSVNAYLFNTGERLVLIDAGTGELLGTRLGHLVTNLQASGYEPAQVDDVILTHIHADHSGGLTVAGEPVFPKALVHVNRRDADYWLEPDNLAAAPEETRQSFREAVASLRPYVDAGRLRTFDDNASPIPGFGSILRSGHTPGHSSIVVESQGETFVAWGDIVHGDAVQFDEPSIAIDFDVDASAAVVARQQALVHAAEHGYWVAGAHLPFPGIGHVRTDSDQFDWVAMNYSAEG
ncbi:MBL fold metallo-hydrolase [Halomonas cupida]|uniref:MBL fold metallo-hydrolase n=1 Tax=Halomonas cupida TaxID=44933 RepID=UPI003A8D240D